MDATTISTARRGQRLDREPLSPGDHPRSSAALRDDLARLDADHTAASARLAQLEADRDAVLLTDDDAKAEAHDAEIQRTRRAIERADLKRPGLVEAIAAADTREAAELFTRQQAEASAAVDAVVARLAKEYEAPAKVIAGFLADWQRADELARAAKVPGPDAQVRERAPELIAPAGEDVFIVYIDEQGKDTDQAFPPGSYGLLPDGTADGPMRQRQRRTRERPAKYDAGVYLGSLAGRGEPSRRAGWSRRAMGGERPRAEERPAAALRPPIPVSHRDHSPERRAVTVSVAKIAAHPPGAACSHVDLLRSLADRLEAIGGPAAEMALNELSESTEAHLRTVEMVVAFTEALENTAPIH